VKSNTECDILKRDYRLEGAAGNRGGLRSNLSGRRNQMFETKQEKGGLVVIVVVDEVGEVVRAVTRKGGFVLDGQREGRAIVRSLARGMAHAEGRARVEAYRAERASNQISDQ
jgi:hypothetical protein